MTDPHATPPISIVIPTTGRAAVLTDTLQAVADDAPTNAEVIVVVEAGENESRAAAEAVGAKVAAIGAPAPPGAARNAGIAAAGSPLCLLFDDDVRPVRGLIGAHLEFHAANQDPMVAMMGLVVPAPPLDRSDFQRWLHTRGVQFGYGLISPGPIEGRYLWVANASFKRAGLEAIGGFDESIGFGSEDADLGIRFAEAGGRIIYRDECIVLHHKPTDLPATLRRMQRIGRVSRSHPDRLAEITRPRPTNARHRVTLAALTAAQGLGLLRGPLRRAAWTALCRQAYREAYWDGGDGAGTGGVELRAGSRLAKRLGAEMARSDPSAG